MKAVFVFCEGPQDSAYIARSLLALGHGALYTGPISDLPTPLGKPVDPYAKQTESLIINHYVDRELGIAKLSQARHAPVPAFETIILDEPRDRLYALLPCGGCPTKDPAGRELVEKLHLALDPMLGPDITDGAVAFVVDADASRTRAEEAVRDYCTPLFGLQADLRHGVWLDTPPGPLGCYIWHDDRTGEGTLETLAGPLLATALGDEWMAAEAYVDERSAAAALDASKRIKAIAGSAVQPHRPGGPASLIFHRDIIDGDVIRADSACSSIVDFLARAF